MNTANYLKLSDTHVWATYL